MRSDLWSLDEYVVVADLYLRRGPSSGVSDPGVIKLAQLTGRTPASINRRLGNFDGTARPGNGLKPVGGEALRAFEQMRASTEIQAQMALAAEQRLSSSAVATTEGGMAGPRLGDPENHRGDPIEVSTAAQVRQVERAEAELVRRYRTWLDPDGTRLRGMVIPADGSLLRVDLFDPQRHLLIEAEAGASRNHLRQAVGQLLDYQRYLCPVRPWRSSCHWSRAKILCGCRTRLGSISSGRRTAASYTAPAALLGWVKKCGLPPRASLGPRRSRNDAGSHVYEPA